MRLVLRMAYAAVAQLAAVAASVVPASDQKFALALRARRGIRRRYEAWARANRDTARPLLWVHAASVGETIMARPVIDAFRAGHPEAQVALTFFSPSAEEYSRKLDVDFREYLPFDRAGDMGAALEQLRPAALVFSKVDVWPELARQARRRGVRLGLISASLPEGSSRRGAISQLLLRDAYGALDAVGAVDGGTAARLRELGVRGEAIEVTGDTAYDVAWQRVTGDPPETVGPVLDRLRSSRPTIVAGSTWPADEAPLLEGYLRARRRVADLRLVVAPHEMDAAHLAQVERWADRHGLRCARVDAESVEAADVVLVDRFGLLAFLYGVGQVSFVGGGFHDAGLHSVVEPAAHGTPVLFGPRHQRSRDAATLLQAKGARVVTDAASAERALVDYLTDEADRAVTGERARSVVASGRGAVARSLALVERLMSG
ncbi:MAG TPA: glycosyltransferase N-terminal domain-containing protein [Gemmatimonadaceae bacterium]|nr:glycosyltransferase N-terminal domain-containing protein [Gemmatimonadaceae bacterium]